MTLLKAYKMKISYEGSIGYAFKRKYTVGYCDGTNPLALWAYEERPTAKYNFIWNKYEIDFSFDRFRLPRYNLFCGKTMKKYELRYGVYASFPARARLWK